VKSIVFASCNEQPGVQPGDLPVVHALNAMGVNAAAAPWNGDFAPFKEADLVAVRSTWDYPATPAAFDRWLQKLDALPAVVNPPRLMRWNFDKRYLLALAAAGAPLAPTVLAENTPDALHGAMESLCLEIAVVKPIVGATGSGLSIVDRAKPQTLRHAARRLDGPGLVQPFIPEIRRGETSFIFVDGDFTHAVVKIPKQGEILCQSDHGGAVKSAQPPDFAVARAAEILEMLPERPVYARVDAIVLDDRVILMEVEVIEPELFFVHAPAAADRFAAALLKRLD
jgi:glutathione synthase/RimK-type ligase-like ATP-grasp enzyme